MSFQYSFFTDSIRYLTACGQLPYSEIALSSNSTCVNNQDRDSTTSLSSAQITWSVLQSVVAVVLFISSALIGIRARRGTSAIIPSTLVLFMVVSMIGHGVASAESWTLGYYGEVGYWGGGFVLALLFYTFDLERIPLGAFALTSTVGAACMLAEFIKPGALSASASDLNNAELCSIFGVPIVLGAILGGVCCRKRRLRSGTLFSATQSGLDEDGVYYENEDSAMSTVRYGGKGHIFLHVFAGSFCQAFIVAPLVFAACKFEGCPAIWQIESCHVDSQDPALAVVITTLAGTSLIGLICQLCWAYRSVREADRNNYVAGAEIHNHFKEYGANDLLAEDRASRSVLRGQSTGPLDNRWSRMVQDVGY